MKPFETLTSAGQLRRLRQLAGQVLAAYDIPQPRLTPLRHEDNTTFRIDAATGQRYVLRIHRPSRKTAEAVRSEMVWLAALSRDTDLIVSEPVPTRTGELVTVTGVAGVPEPQNYLFHQGQVRAIDFDDCGYGYYLYDMAVTLFNVHWRDNAAILRAGFLAGYGQVRPISAEHEQYIQTFMDLRDLQMMIWAIEMRNHPAFRDRWVKEVKEVLDYIKTVVEA